MLSQKIPVTFWSLVFYYKKNIIYYSKNGNGVSCLMGNIQKLRFLYI